MATALWVLTAEGKKTGEQVTIRRVWMVFKRDMAQAVWHFILCWEVVPEPAERMQQLGRVLKDRPFSMGWNPLAFLTSFITWYTAIYGKTVTLRRKPSSSMWDTFWRKHQTRLLAIKHSCLCTWSHTRPDWRRKMAQKDKTETKTNSTTA